MHHNPQRWQEQLLMELLSGLRSQGGIISTFILPYTDSNDSQKQSADGMNDATEEGGWRFNQAGGANTHEHYVVML